VAGASGVGEDVSEDELCGDDDHEAEGKDQPVLASEDWLAGGVRVE
jgi:hypothetical protein